MKQFKKLKIMMMITTLLPTLTFATESNVQEQDGFPELMERYTKHAQRYDLQQIQKIEKGLSKDQVRFILGNPHFDESLFFVKTWNYIVDVQKPNSIQYDRCQLKIEFNRQSIAEDIGWKGASCSQERFDQQTTSNDSVALTSSGF